MGFEEMINTQKTFAAAAILAVAGTSFAQVTPGSFTPDAIDDYESYPGARAPITSLFGGDVAVIDGAVFHASVDAGNWQDFRSPGGPIQPTSGSKFGTLFGFGDITLDFSAIGGITGLSFSASAAGVGADIIEFFDASGNLIGSFTDADGYGPGDGTMEQLSFISTEPIFSVRLDGPETAFDDMGITSEASGGPLDILVYDQNSVSQYAQTAANNVGDNVVVAGVDTFNAELTGGDWDVVVVDMPSTLLTDFNPLIDYINGGGATVVSTWFAGWDPLLTAMGALGGTSFSTQANPSITSTGTPEADIIFDGVTTPITDFFQQWGSDGVQANPAPGSIAVAQQAGAGDPVVWVGNDGRTIGSWVADEMNDGAQAVQLWENYITFVGGGGDECRADCDGDGDLTLFDFLCFQNLFDAGDLAADFDGDGSLTLFDFLAFQNEFDAGCE